ncbi:hypothetical protein L7F22_068460 [Adiantum nelumboides]|nr:hypothetical protein [Adiantum nelumboides]
MKPLEPASDLGTRHSQASAPMFSNGQHSEQQQGCSQNQSQQRRRQRSGRAPKHPSSRTYSQSHRRIYDVRTWHRRKSVDKLGNLDWGQPPAGWVLVWAGRFKGWRRRWFLAHPAGLLLYYKNSNQVGRPGCISLQGAEVSPTSGKERQFKIRRGTIVYYLRTLNKENRQAWLETIHRSIGTYERSWQKVGVVTKSGRALTVQQSVPTHLAEEWKQQEIEVNRRLAEKLQELEPMRLAFLQHVQGVQQSLSVLTEAFGFGSRLKTRVETSPPLGPREQARPSYSPPLYPYPNGKLPPVKSQGASKAGLYPSLSDPIPCLEVNEVVLDEHCSNHSSIVEDGGGVLENKQAGCMGRELFKLRRRESNGTNFVEKGHSSDTEVCSSSTSSCKRAPAFKKDTDEGFKQEHVTLPTSYSVDSFPLSFTKSPDKDTDGGLNKDEAAHSNSQKGPNSYAPKEKVHSNSPSATPPSCSSHTMQGQLHAAWNTMQETFAELLKEEIQRVIELEAENAVLQQSLVMLPQLQQDHKDLLDLRERMQRNRSNRLVMPEDRDMDGEFGDDEDTDDEVSLAPSDATNEDYYEALEVLNQHEFIAKSTSPEELELLGERIEYCQEPPEEGDLSNDTENLSEVEGDDYEQPRSRLPAPRPLQRGFSLWSVLKNAIGKDLNHITMPATINEPLSVLQRCAEELQYSHLLEKASQLEDSVERLVWVSIFACATYHGSIHRDAKPFNPLLGETYEWQSLDGHLRFIAEQVSHHPPVLAFHSENVSSDYSIYGEVEIKNRFWGKSVEVVSLKLTIALFVLNVCESEIKRMNVYGWTKWLLRKVFGKENRD